MEYNMEFVELNFDEMLLINGGNSATGWAILGSVVTAVGLAICFAVTAPIVAAGCILGAAVALPIGIGLAMGGTL